MRVSTVREEWAPIADFPNYEVSTFGRVFNVQKDRFLKGSIKYERYPRVEIVNQYETRKTSIHLLVANAFIEKPISNRILEVNHIDGNKLNSHVSNLEWVTKSENVKHAYRLGLATPNRHGMRDFMCLETNEIFESIRGAAKELGTNMANIQAVLSGKRSSWHGLHFEYLDN